MARILVVEDDISEQVLLQQLLSKAGHTVVIAADGSQALDRIREDKIDAVVTDLRMPVLNGLRLIRELREAGDTIPIVGISGENADQLMLAQDYGANAGLVKPLNRDDLLAVLDRIVRDTRSDWSGAWIHPEFGKVGER